MVVAGAGGWMLWAAGSWAFPWRATKRSSGRWAGAQFCPRLWTMLIGLDELHLHVEPLVARESGRYKFWLQLLSWKAERMEDE